MRKFICPECLREHESSDAICCKDVGHLKVVDFGPVSSAAWGQQLDTEVVGDSLDIVLVQAARLLALADPVGDPHIVSKLRTADGRYVVRVRSYSLD